MIELVSPIPVEEVPAWVKVPASAFLSDREGAGTDRWTQSLTRDWQPERAWGARDSGTWVAALRSEQRLQSVPGLGAASRDLPVHALTNVAVAATHRRRGLMSRMIEGSLDAAREQGEAVSILIAAEWPIYGRFGYAPATFSADYMLRRSRRGAIVDGDVSAVRQVDRDEVAHVAPAVFEAARRTRVGQINRSPQWWNRALGRDGFPPVEDLPGNWLIHEAADGPDGLLAWTATGDFGLIPPLGSAQVWTLATASDAAYRDLWAYLTGIDLLDEIRLGQRPVDEPARWLLADARTLVMTQHADFTWLRLLDVPAALMGRSYAVDGELVLEVGDEAPGAFAAGRFRLRSHAGAVACEPTREEPDIVITQPALASMYLGGVRLAELPAVYAQEQRTGARDLLDLMFSTPRPPWNATWF